MAATVTGEQVLQEVIKRAGIGIYLANAEIGGLAAGTVTSVLHLRNAGSGGADRYQGQIVYRPGNATGVADYVRFATTVTTAGVLSVDTDWADSTLGSENVYILERGLTPTQFVDALNSALQHAYFDTEEPLSIKPAGAIVADAGFQSTATSNVTTSSATFTKVGTADSENVYLNRLNAGRIQTSGAGGGVYQDYSVRGGRTVNAWSLTRLDSGTASELYLFDVTNSAAIGTIVEHAQEDWQFIHRTEDLPESLKILRVQHQGEGASDDIYINGQWVYVNGMRRFPLDSQWDWSREPRLAYLNLRSGTATSNVFDGYGVESTAIYPGRNTWSWIENPTAANPLGIQFHTDSYFNYPIVIEGRRAYSDETTFTLALTETTSCPIELLEALVSMELFSNGGPMPDGVRLAAARDRLSRQDTQPKNQHAARKRPFVRNAGLRS